MAAAAALAAGASDGEARARARPARPLAVDDRRNLDDDRAVEMSDVVRRLREVELAFAASISKGSGGTPVDVIRAALSDARARAPDDQNECAVPDPSLQRLMVALCSRYSLDIYHHPKRRSRTLMVRAPSGFMRDVFTPLFEEMCRVIDAWHFERTEALLRAFAAPCADEPVK